MEGAVLEGTWGWDKPASSSAGKQTLQKDIYCHLSESSLAFSLFPVSSCHIHTLLLKCWKCASWRKSLGERNHTGMLSFALSGHLRGTRPTWLLYPVSTSKKISPAPVYVRPQEWEDRWEGKKGMRRLEVLTLGFSSLGWCFSTSQGQGMLGGRQNHGTSRDCPCPNPQHLRVIIHGTGELRSQIEWGCQATHPHIKRPCWIIQVGLI